MSQIMGRRDHISVLKQKITLAKKKVEITRRDHTKAIERLTDLEDELAYEERNQ